MQSQLTSKPSLTKVSRQAAAPDAHNVVKLLLADHRLLRSLMSKVKSHRATDSEKIKAFKDLEKVVKSHVQAEEVSLLKLIRDNPKFQDIVLESYEEHRVHESVLAGLHRVSDKDRRLEQMKIFCEFLEHHLDEEEEELFPRFNKYAATSTRKKLGKKYLNVRKQSNGTQRKRGAARFAN